MHSYERPAVRRGSPAVVDLEAHRFGDAWDVVALAEIDLMIGWRTWPEVWHLDAEGAMRCASRGSSLDSIRSWADDPWPLERTRLEGERSGGCADRWLIIESRPSSTVGAGPIVTEADAEAFFRLRRLMAEFGVHLLDDVVFDDAGHWWSLHELTTGSTAWRPAVRS